MNQIDMKEFAPLVKDIFAWYVKHKRNLPWRHTSNPYRILVSEVMLQQTQVERVIPKYKAFLSTFPNVRALAAASPGDVIRAWAGLGYNRRALFLQKTAQTILSDFKGIFPKTKEELKTLPGIGEYTAHALLSFAFDQPVPVLDTNHRKFYARLFSQKKVHSDKELIALAQELITDVVSQYHMPTRFQSYLSPRERKVSSVYHWNQALMDLMSAVSRGDADRLIQYIQERYPEQEKKKIKKKTIPFRQTDRYYRGRIIDALRKTGRLSFADLRGICADIDEKRYTNIVAQLEKDGLIKQMKQGIVFP